ncbi:MAG: hypothetical protein A2675_04260 [Candidatus Yonathbacteria bacterium RIFCSPHIGHO2_01_FULL_51_10]|uniref:Protease PrsW n=1 Tax=Candidatus Yonathbacteria bacterium RIFCSPHIGHO2_01_FULL_51_10 TaxID=1802723 RepID=A0A1G2S852_9BACT|nr:MAG: hypothetical protein A2675_04260 [Candidatus Yonathbacteria bacterium RIFCSPHIGHO2_01_FULL_51_10]
MAAIVLTIPQAFLLSLAGGILPVLIWLWFWLKEDREHPEPKRLTALAFCGGMITALAAVPIEQSLFAFATSGATSYADALVAYPHLVVLFAGVEELFKYFAFALVALGSRYFDEPIDALIYMITVALGFAAAENTLYLLNTITQSGLVLGLLNGNLRFIGATLLHVASSAFIGIALGFAFYRGFSMRIAATIVGILAATSLHAVFNFSILKVQSIGDALGTFAIFWSISVLIILIFERIKRVYPVNPIA